MKKTVIGFAMAILLVFSASGTVLAADGGNGTEGLSPGELGPNASLQLMFAKLQLEQAELARNQAMEGMEQIERLQDEQRQVAGFLNTARRLQSEAESTGEATEMPGDMAAYMDANGLSYDATGGDLAMTGEEWDTAIRSLEYRLEEVGMETQQQMVYVQDFMGQYNSYTQGTNTQIPNSDQTLTSLARGQSMYGDSEAGLAVTSLVVGLVLGCVITLAAQKLRAKKEKA